MRSEGFQFYTLGVWGLRCVRWTPFFVRNRRQPFATVCNRLQPFATVCNCSHTILVAESCRVYGNSCKRGDFWMFQVLCTCISRGKRGTL